jgi:hypothetical protein
MEYKPKFMSSAWQRKLMKERPIAFSLLCFVLTFPLLILLRLGFNGELGSLAQMTLRIFAAVLALGLLWLIVEARRGRKHRDARIDAYLERRYDQIHERGPPEA